MRRVIPVEVEANNPKLLIKNYMQYITDSNPSIDEVASVRNRIKAVVVRDDVELKLLKSKSLEILEEQLKYMRKNEKRIVVFADVVESEIVSISGVARKLVMLKLHNIYLIDLLNASELPVKAMKEPSIKACFFTDRLEAYREYGSKLKELQLGNLI